MKSEVVSSLTIDPMDGVYCYTPRGNPSARTQTYNYCRNKPVNSNVARPQRMRSHSLW